MGAMSTDAGARPDARWIRAHRALHDAVLVLAAEQPIADVSLAKLALAAGVSRSTAYEHASSARELLEQALVAELDSARDENLLGVGREDIPEATAATTAAVAEHIDRHSGIYRIGLADDAGPSSLNGMLAKHFAASTQMLLDTGGLVHGMAASDGAEAEAIDALVVNGIAQSAVGQFAAWIALPAPRDPALFARVNLGLLPAWWRV